MAASRRAGYLDGVNAAVRAVATGDSPTALIEQVSGQLTELLSLRSCRFQYGVAGIGRPARLQCDGRVMARSRPSGFPYEDLPLGFDTELLVETSGLLQGRFLMTPGPRRVRPLSNGSPPSDSPIRWARRWPAASRRTASRNERRGSTTFPFLITYCANANECLFSVVVMCFLVR